MCVNVCMRLCTRVHMYVHVRKSCVFFSLCVRERIYAYAHQQTGFSVHVRAHLRLCMSVRDRVRVCVRVRVRVRVYVRACVRV